MVSMLVHPSFAALRRPSERRSFISGELFACCSRVPDEVLLYALGFLEAKDLLSLSMCAKTANGLATEPLLWLPKCLQAWSLPTSTPAAHVLPSLASKGSSLHQVYPHIADWPEELEMRERPTGSTPFEVGALDPHTVRLISNHGQNRAIRSTKPFPDLPCAKDGEEESVWDRLVRIFRCKACVPLASSYDHICGNHGGEARPFSAPWVHADGSLDVSLRLVAYYEVTICPSDSEREYSGCVAVGLGLHDFPLEGFMPGWDSTSFAYHSDDGGIFHGTGIKVRYYGPRFGPNDVVGCGLDYVTGEIFFTLNGQYLGVAFEGVHGRLYPTVGIDAINPLTINFGDHAFAFDLGDYMANQHHRAKKQQKEATVTEYQEEEDGDE